MELTTVPLLFYLLERINEQKAQYLTAPVLASCKFYRTSPFINNNLKNINHMTKSIKFLTTLVAIIFLSSFTDKNPNAFWGSYGVSATDPSQIKLTINSDNTFYYQDFSIPAKKIEVTGNWTLKGNKVFLIENNGNKKFHNVWTIIENGQVAKSHKGLLFYRLCKING
jgi:hypothetical protein